MASLPLHDDCASALLHKEWPSDMDFGYPQHPQPASGIGHARTNMQRISLTLPVALTAEQSTPRKRKRGNDFAEQPGFSFQRSDLRTSPQASYVQQHMQTPSYHLQQHYSPSPYLSPEQGYLCSSTPQLAPHSFQEGGYPQCIYPALDSCQYFQPTIVPELDYEGYVSQSPGALTSPSSLQLAYKTCVVNSPILDHRAAHTLTYLRSASDGEISCFNRSTSFPCEEQVCTKDDCPETKVICPAEKIEAQFCDGNCAGRLCTGAGCPYDNDMSASLLCNWDPGNGVCNLPHQGAIHDNFGGSIKTLDPQNCLLQCGGLSPHRKPHFKYGNRFLCHDGDCPPFLDADICYDPSCIPHDEVAQFYWQHCKPALIGQDEPMEPINTIHQHFTSESSTPVSRDELEGSTASKTCLWVVDTASEQLCDFTCQHGNVLQKHLEETHFNPQKPQRCQKRPSSSNKKALICRWKNCKYHLQNKTFGQMQALRQHGYTHSGYKSAQCTICGQMFVDKVNLEGHMRTHTGEKPYTCRYCGYKSAARATWITHERTHTGEKTLHCDLCSYSCGDSSNFARHKASHGEGKFQCEVCRHSFKRHEHLTRHMKSGVHSGDKNHGEKRRSGKEKAPAIQHEIESILM